MIYVAQAALHSNAFPNISETQVISSVRLEPVVVLAALALGSWLFYKIFLKRLSLERHRIFERYFTNLGQHILVGVAAYSLYEFLFWFRPSALWSEKISIYLGLIVITWGCVVFIKILRILTFEYLFMTSMKAGVPLLLGNILTLAASGILLVWALTTFFEIQLAPILATSALFSVVLGLALQDTLGNLFSAIAIQLDKPYDLGDWIEIRNGSDCIAGQVREISWRATLLLAITDEMITVPNRFMSQSQILNFSGRERSFIRSQMFRIPHGASIETAKHILLGCMALVDGIERDPAPVVIVTETTESWISIKAVYNIKDYGAQFGIADRFVSLAVSELKAAGLPLATPRLTIDRGAEILLPS